MLCDTHQKIADKVFETVRKELSIKLDYNSLLSGSIAPDIVPSMLVIPHMYRSASKLLYQRIDSLCGLELNYHEKDLADFSYELGIVIHYISDFFCRTHNSRFKFINFVTHRIYEKKLKNFFDQNIKNYHCFVGKMNWREPINGIQELLPSKIREYGHHESSFNLDMKYSIEMSLNIALKIVSRCIENRFDAVRKAA